MQCKNCGREVAGENVNFCEYCGTPMGTEAPREEKTERPEVFVQPAMSMPRVEAPRAERVPTSTFLGIMFLPLIPFVGGILYLIYMFYWAFSSSITDSRKSYARANLIYAAILCGVAILFGIIVVVLAMMGYSSLMNYAAMY